MNWSEESGINYLFHKQTGADTAVMLFHGYGADANDLAPLSQVIDQEGRFDWYFPQGILEVPIGPMMTGRGWFSIENRDWEALMRGEIDDSPFTETTKKTLESVLGLTHKLLDSYDKVFIGGFSQGAILTSHAFYRYNFVPKGLILMSGYLNAPSEYPTIPDQLKVPFIQSHGQADQVLPLAGAKKLYSQLTEFGLPGEFVEFMGGHEIPMEVIAKVKAFIEDQL